MYPYFRNANTSRKEQLPPRKKEKESSISSEGIKGSRIGHRRSIYLMHDRRLSLHHMHQSGSLSERNPIALKVYVSEKGRMDAKALLVFCHLEF